MAQRTEWGKCMSVEVTWAMIAEAVMVGVETKDPRNGMRLKPRDRRIGKARVLLEAIVERANAGRQNA